MFPLHVESYNVVHNFIKDHGFKIDLPVLSRAEVFDISLTFDPGVIPRFKGDDVVHSFILMSQMLAGEQFLDVIKRFLWNDKFVPFHNPNIDRGLKVKNQLEETVDILRGFKNSLRGIITFANNSDPLGGQFSTVTIQVTIVNNEVVVSGHFMAVSATNTLQFELIMLNAIGKAIATELGLKFSKIVMHIGRLMISHTIDFAVDWTMGRVAIPNLASLSEFKEWGHNFNTNLITGALSKENIEKIFFEDDPDQEEDDMDVVIDELDDGMTHIELALRTLSDTQKIVSGMVPGCISDPPTNRQICEAAYAMNEEVHELVRKVGWKSWKKNPTLTDEQIVDVVDEYADILAFQGLLTHLIMLRTGITAEDLASGYAYKTIKNIQRFMGESGEAGYVGVKNLSETERADG